MTYVVTEDCIGCLDKSCIEECPEDCFYLYPSVVSLRGIGAFLAGADDVSNRNGMLMIHPDECISCGACETECPVEAIYEVSLIPEGLDIWALLNARYTRLLKGEKKERVRQHSS